jgi:hypothetical protein
MTVELNQRKLRLAVFINRGFKTEENHHLVLLKNQKNHRLIRVSSTVRKTFLSLQEELKETHKQILS